MGKQVLFKFYSLYPYLLTCTSSSGTDIILNTSSILIVFSCCE